MALNVAELTATLGFQAKGAASAAGAAKKVQKSVEGVTKATSLQQGEVQRLARIHQQNIAALKAAKAEFESFGKTESQVRAEAKLLEAEWKKLGDRIVELQAQVAKGLISDDQFTSLIQETIASSVAFKEQNAQAIGAVDALMKVESATKAAASSERSLTRAQKAMAKSSDLSRTALNGLISAARTGRISTTLIGEAVSAFAGRLVQLATTAVQSVTALGAVSLAVAAIPFVAVAFGINALNSEFGQLAQSMSTIPDEAEAISRSLQGIEGVGVLDLAKSIQGARSRYASRGIEDPNAAAAATAKLTEVGQFLNSTPDDFASTFSAIQTSIERLEFRPLRNLGVNVDALNAKMAELADQGLSKAERRIQAVALLQADLASRTKEAGDQARRESNTWAGFQAEIGRIIQQVFTSDEMQVATQAFVSNLRKALPFIRGFFRIVGAGFKFVLDTANFFLNGFIWVINTIIDSLEYFANSALNVAQALGFFADTEQFDFQGLEADIVSVNSEMSNLEDAFAGAGDGAESAASDLEKVEEALQKIRDQVSGGQGVISGIVAYGDALGDLDEFGDPQAIFGVIGAIENLQDLALRGIDLTNFQNELVRLRDAGIITIDQYRTAIEQIAAADEIFQPFAEEADNLRASVEQAEAPMQTAKGQIATTGDAADTARNQIADLGDQIVTTARTAANNPIIATYSISGYADYTLGLSQPGPFGLRVPGTPIAPPTLSNTPELSRPTSGPGSNTLAPPSADNSQVAAESARFASIRKAAEDNNNAAQANQDAVRAFTDAQRSSARSGGGGGGGGSAAQDEGATLDQIRELVNQVNDAISIASRGGTRIGTGGNVVPFEEGSFLDSRGGDLNIQTIQIRGIWDFANPEAKRQILRELEDALEDLKAEAI